MFFVFLGYYTTFCLVLYKYLSDFGHKPLRERGDGRSPPHFLIREFSVLTRLKRCSRESGRLSRSELPFRPGGRLGPIKECSLTVLPVMMLKKNNTQERHKNIYVTFARKNISTENKAKQ